VSRALADCFLAAEHWRRDSLLEIAMTVVGRRPELIGAAADVALSRYPVAPRDAPRALAAFLQASAEFETAFAELTRKWPVEILRRVATPTTATASPFGLPRVDTVRDLAVLLDVTTTRLEWYADSRMWNRRAPDGPLHHYRYEWVQRPGRTPRLLEVPMDRLKKMQRSVLDLLLSPLPVHNAAHGFVRGRTALTGAAEHVDRDVVVGADLVSFFANVSARTVYGVLRGAGLPEPVAYQLTGLCTHAVPVRVIAAMPPGGNPDERHRLRSALATPHLPQGSPSSPALANLSVSRLDSRLAGWAASVDGRYTRYADDLTFSGDGQLARRVDPFLRGLARIVADEGHTLNARKTRVRRRGVRQSVTGIVVNDHPTVGRREYDALKAILHNCLTHGAASQNRAQLPDWAAHLRGRVSWFEQVDPVRGARLRAQLERIQWSA
jgi:RNA-directed DNA polymerase